MKILVKLHKNDLILLTFQEPHYHSGTYSLTVDSKKI